MNFDFLFGPVEELDSLLGGLFDGAPLLLALALALLLGLGHASDPDHLVAVARSWRPTAATPARPRGSAPGGVRAMPRCCS